MHYSIEYWTNWGKAAGVRALKTVAQASIAAIGAATMFTAVDWKVVVSTALLAGIMSLLTSIAGLPEVAEGDFAADEDEVAEAMNAHDESLRGEGD